MGRPLHLVIQFDGTDFLGWQRQATGRTVQGEVERVLARLCDTQVPLHGAGRTDAGVHAIGMSGSCVVPDRWTPHDLRKALNALLPTDCWIARAEETVPGFHARTCATHRSYRYDLGVTESAHSPFRRPFSWALGRPLDRYSLETLATDLVGVHDFRRLAVHTAERRNTLCTITHASWAPEPSGDHLSFSITANRFLHHMVRILVGTMVDIARGRRNSGDLGRLLTLETNLRASPPAPPQGLFFVTATYPERWFLLDGGGTIS